MAKASDNVFPKVILSEGTAPASPSAGQQKFFVDSADHKLKRVNSAGVVTTVEATPITVQDENSNVSTAVTQIDFQGAGVTATAGTGEIVVTVPGGSGGSSYPPGSADLPPASPNAKDDEFDGSSAVTWTSTPTAPTSFDINTTRTSHAVLRSNGNGNNTVGKYQAVPGAYPFTVTAKLAGHAAHGAANRAGIFLAPTGPISTSANLLLESEVAASAHNWSRILNSSFTTTFVSGVNGLVVPVTSGAFRDFGPMYFRLKVNSATSVDSSLSRDGWNWVTFESAFNPGFTPGVMGIFVSELGTADTTAHFDWFRIT